MVGFKEWLRTVPAEGDPAGTIRYLKSSWVQKQMPDDFMAIDQLAAFMQTLPVALDLVEVERLWRRFERDLKAGLRPR